MNTFDLLGQTYLMCTVFGWGFIVFSLVMGHSGHEGHADDGGHAISHDDSGGHSHGVLDAAHGIHHLDGGGGAAHVGHGHSGLTGGHHTAGGHDDGHDGGHHDGHQDGENGRTGTNPVIQHNEKNLYFTLLSLFSPMSLSVFIGFFGFTGLALRSFSPWMSWFTLIPAVLAGIAATNVMKYVLAWATSKLTASSLTSSQQAIGQIAEVNTPIKEGRLGEVSYIIGLTRFNAAARPAQAGSEIARGAKVIIVETDGPVVLVEPFSDHQLDGH